MRSLSTSLLILLLVVGCKSTGGGPEEVGNGHVPGTIVLGTGPSETKQWPLASRAFTPKRDLGNGQIECEASIRIYNYGQMAVSQLNVELTLKDQENRPPIFRKNLALTVFKTDYLGMVGPVLPQTSAKALAQVVVPREVLSRMHYYWYETISVEGYEKVKPNKDPIRLFMWATTRHPLPSDLDGHPEYWAMSDPKSGTTLAHVACTLPDGSLLNYGAAKGADLRRKTISGYEPIHVATWCNSIAALQVLADKKVPVDAVTSDGSTSYMLAAENGCIASEDWLYRHHANVRAKDKNGWEALDRTLMYPHAANWIPLLLAHGADPNHVGPNSVAPLHLACSDPGEIDSLIRAGAKVNLQAGAVKWTPLHQAAKFGTLRGIQSLLAHGANPFLRTNNHNTPADIAHKYNRPEQEAALRQAMARFKKSS
jgi:ankyrin repeat protein